MFNIQTIHIQILELKMKNSVDGIKTEIYDSKEVSKICVL